MAFPVIVDPNMTIPVMANDLVPDPNSAMQVPIWVRPGNLPIGTNIYISICIRIKIGGVTISIYYGKYALVLNQAIIFETILPVGSEILDIKPSYTMAYGAN